jgi:hypothetical protein
MPDYLQQTLADVGPVLLNVLAAILILFVGYLLAKVFARLVRRGLGRTSIDERIAGALSGDRPVSLSRVVSKGVFYVVLLLALIASLQVLNLTFVTEPINAFLSSIFAYMPKVIAALVLAAAAYIVASVLRVLSRKALKATNVDARLAADDHAVDSVPVSETISTAVYYLVFLLFLPAILGSLEMRGLLSPVEGLVDELLAFLPNLFAAAVILVIGYFVAKLIRKIVTNLLAAAGTDKLAERVGLSSVLGTQRLSSAIGTVVYVLVLLPVLVASLNALAIDAVTGPASQMLDLVMSAIPKLFAAGVVLAIAYVVGRLVAGLITNLLAGIGFDRVLANVGLLKSTAPDSRVASNTVGTVVLVAVMLFAAMEAANLMGFAALTGIIQEFLGFAGQLALGLVIFALGLFISNVAYKAVNSSGLKQAALLAMTTRISIIVLAGAMALRQMGLANSIINLAFGLILGAIAVAAAVAFGIGGRDVAKGYLERTVGKFSASRKRSSDTTVTV